MRINIILLPCYGEIIDEVLAFFYENTNCKKIKKNKNPFINPLQTACERHTGTPL
jgi:hypothetical protein